MLLHLEKKWYADIACYNEYCLGASVHVTDSVSLCLYWLPDIILTLAFPQVEMTGDYTPDLVALLSADIIISTPEKWDGISRNWHTRSYVKKVHLFVSRFLYRITFFVSNL